MRVRITCPVCQQPLDASVTMIEETEGDATIPNGTRTFMALDNYRIDWPLHRVSLHMAARVDDDVTVPEIECEKQIAANAELDDKLVDALIFHGGQASDDEIEDARARRQVYPNEHD